MPSFLTRYTMSATPPVFIFLQISNQPIRSVDTSYMYLKVFHFVILFAIGGIVKDIQKNLNIQCKIQKYFDCVLKTSFSSLQSRWSLTFPLMLPKLHRKKPPSNEGYYKKVKRKSKTKGCIVLSTLVMFVGFVLDEVLTFRVCFEPP